MAPGCAVGLTLGFQLHALCYASHEFSDNCLVLLRDQVKLRQLNGCKLWRVWRLSDNLRDLLHVFFRNHAALEKYAGAFTAISRASCFELSCVIERENHDAE